MKLYLYRAKSDEEFIDIAKREGCDTVVVQSRIKARHFAKAARIGAAAFFEYFVKMSANTTPITRKVVFKKLVFERTAVDRGAMDEGERKKSAIELLLLCEKTAEGLRAKIPGATVMLTKPDGEIIDLEQLHRDAAEYGVSV